MEDKRFNVDATPDMAEIDRNPAADRPNRIPTLSAIQWDNKKVIGAAAIGGAAIFGLLTLVTGFGTSAELEKVQKQEKPAAVEAPYDPNSVIAPTLATAATDPNAPVKLTTDQVPAIGPDGQPITPYPGSANGQNAPTEAERRAAEAQEVRDNARRSSLVAYNSSQGGLLGSQTGGGGPRQTGAGESGEGNTDTNQGKTKLDQLKQTSAIDRVRGRMIGDRDYLVTAGAVIPCTLQTAMDSSVPGYATCIIPRDIYSDNGRVVLMEKGTKVFGEYQGGLQRGQNRLFAMWTRAVTPRGVAMDIGSPASDALGRAGIGGKIDRFFWQRFGAAMLFSVLDAAAQVGGQAVGPSGQTVINTPGQTTSQVLQDTQQIQPIVRVNQGSQLAITVARDFDFSSVYGLSLK